MFCLSHTCQLHLINSCDTAPRNTPVNLQVGSSTVLWSIKKNVKISLSLYFSHNHGSVENSYIWKVTFSLGGTPLFDLPWLMAGSVFPFAENKKNWPVLPVPSTKRRRFGSLSKLPEILADASPQQLGFCCPIEIGPRTRTFWTAWKSDDTPIRSAKKHAKCRNRSWDLPELKIWKKKKRDAQCSSIYWSDVFGVMTMMAIKHSW